MFTQNKQEGRIIFCSSSLILVMGFFNLDVINVYPEEVVMNHLINLSLIHYRVFFDLDVNLF